MKEKKESEKAALKLNIKKMKNIIFGLITLHQIDGGKVETVKFHFLVIQSHCRW